MPHQLNSHVLPQQKEDEREGDRIRNDLPNSNHSNNGTSSTSVISSDDWSYATQELLDALPQAWTRGLLYLLVVFAGIILPWSMLYKVDETGTARGRLEPKSRTFKVDAPVGGTVAKVLVNEGETVKEKQPLLELDSEEIRNEIQQAQTKLEGQINRLAQLDMLKNQLLLALRAQEQQNGAQELAKLAQVDQAKQNLDASKTSYNLQKVEKLSLVDQARQELDASQTAYSLAKSRLGRDEAEVQRYRKLWKEGVIPEIQVVEKEKLAEESRRLLAQSESNIKQAKLRLTEQQSRYQSIIYQAQSDIEQAKLRLEEQQRSYQSMVQSGKLAVLKSEEQIKEQQTQITALQVEIAQSKTQIQSLEYQLGQRVVRAPANGTIFQLPIQRTGAVVQPSTLIAEIAPDGSPFILRAQMATSESGSLREGMPVKMKFDAYPFQDYGVVEGKVFRISPTSKVTETPQGQIATFDLEIELKQNCIQTSKGCIKLNSGQTATAEVIVRQRRIIDFILDPFKKLQNGDLKL